LIDLLHALNAEGAKYLMVGAYAFAFHGRARATSDVDLFVGADADNAKRVWRALMAFSAPLTGLNISEFASLGTFFIMGRPPNQIDVITAIDGVTFEHAWSRRVDSSYGGVPISYIGRDDLIANKKASNLRETRRLPTKVRTLSSDRRRA
jgi:hypothetical protein